MRHVMPWRPQGHVDQDGAAWLIVDNSTDFTQQETSRSELIA